MSVMQISRRVDYALRAVLYLRAHREAPVSIAEISEDQSVPRKFLEKIVVDLARAGVVRSKRGAGGGYTLGRGAEDISFREIIEAVDGPIRLNVCVGEQKDCALTATCGMLPVWEEGQRRVLDLYEQTTLADI